MEKTFSTFVGAFLALLAVSGFVKNSQPKRLFGLINVDIQHSMLRVPLTIADINAALPSRSLKTTRALLSLIGTVYMVMGAIGTTDRKVSGLLPSKLTNFDLGYHFVTGALALWMGMRSGRMLKDS